MTSDSTAQPEEVAMIAVTTAALWLLCLTVGVAGLFLAYPRPLALRPQAPPMEAQLVNVQIAGAALPRAPSPQADAPALPPAAPSVPDPPAAPQLIAVAVASPAIPFAQPVEGPTTTVSARQAAPAAQSATASGSASGPPVERLVYGEGAGRQPKPDYPREAALSHEEGAVLVRFRVDESGSVTSANAVDPSPFALLNQSAVRTIRDEWRFPAGPARLYEVSITFQLR